MWKKKNTTPVDREAGKGNTSAVHMDDIGLEATWEVDGRVRGRKRTGQDSTQQPPNSTTTTTTIASSTNHNHHSSSQNQTTIATATKPPTTIAAAQTTTILAAATITTTCHASDTTEYPYTSSSIVTLSPTVTPTHSSTSVNLCRPICSSQHTLVHDPIDCNHFYTCNITRLTPYPHYTPIRGKCPPERPVFDLKKHSCAADIPCITTCEGVIATTPTTLATSGKPSQVTPIIIPGDDGPCNIYCDKPNSIVRDPTSCHHYFLCIFFDGTVPRPLRIRCPREKPVFDTESKTCQSHAPCRTLNCQQTSSESTTVGSITPSPAGFINNTLTEGTISEKPTPTESVGTKPTQEPFTVSPATEEITSTTDEE
nr:salivary glue protein Sgs-3-like [Penaeus vannamei]